MAAKAGAHSQRPRSRDRCPRASGEATLDPSVTVNARLQPVLRQKRKQCVVELLGLVHHEVV